MSTKCTLFYASDDEGSIHIYWDCWDNCVYIEVEEVDVKNNISSTKMKFSEEEAKRLISLSEKKEADKP